MNIKEFINSYLSQSVYSETEVRTKLANPLFSLLGFEDKYRSEEFPIYGYEGRKEVYTKHADILFFDNGDFNNYRSREHRKWVQEHSLLIVELKKPSESISAEGQAEYYSMWSRVAFYVITNGVEIAFYKIEHYYKDELILRCKINEIPSHWDTIQAIMGFDTVVEFCNNNRSQIKINDNNKYDEYCKAKKVGFDLYMNNSMFRTISSEQDTLSFPMHISGRVKNMELSSVSYKKIFELNESLVILGEAGSGKSFLLRMLANNQFETHFENDSSVIPIIISAKLWNRSFNSLTEGIYNEISPFSENLSISTVESDLKSGKFIILIDGLDETVQSYDMLLQEIKRFIELNIRVIMTCRKNRYHNELNEFAYACELDKLTQEQIQEYVNKELNNIGYTFFHKIGGTISKLIENPLFLVMVTNIMKNTPEQKMPSNKSELYSYFIKFIIQDWTNLKEIPQENNYDISTYKKVLADYSFNTFRKYESDDIFQSSLEKYINRDFLNVEKVFLLNMGILISTVYGPAFYHPSFSEYFYASYLTNLSNDELSNFIEENHKNECFQEIFVFLSGLLRDNQRQSILLDILERFNLRLFYKCLKSRFKFNEKIPLNWDKHFVNNYFLQIRNSYLVLINNHFSQMKNLFFPWINSDNALEETHDVFIKGSFNLSIPAISFELNLAEKGFEKQMVESDYLEGTPTVSTVPNEGEPVTIPIISLSMNNGHYFYNLDMAQLGIDSAREIAFDIIRKQVLDFLKNKSLLFGEDFTLNGEMIEKYFDGISSRVKMISLPKELVGLSLRTHSIDDIITALTPYKKVVGFQLPHGKVIDFNIGLIIYLLSNMKAQNISASEYLLPIQDLPWEQVRGKKCYVWSPYSDEQLCRRISRFYDLFQDSYRTMVEKCFPTLTEDMYLYRIGPIKYNAIIIIEKNDDSWHGGYVELKWVPVKSNDDRKTIVTITDKRINKNHNEIENEFDRLRDQLKILVRDTSLISTGGGGILGLYFRVEVVRDKVYKELANDFENLFKD